MTLPTALRLAGQALAPIVAPAGRRALLKEAALGAGTTLALEQGLPRVLGKEPPPLERTLLRSAAIGALSGPVERTVMAGLKTTLPGISSVEPAIARGLTQAGLPGQVPMRLAGLAAGAGKLGVGFLGAGAITEPVSNAIANVVFPEGYGSGQTKQAYTDIPGNQQQGQEVPVSTMGVMDPAAAVDHQRRMELTYARNYKFPSYIYHVSQQATGDPFQIANQMLSTPTVSYF
jgi:hypothetical protein